MMTRTRLMFTALLTGGALLLTGCTSSTPAPVTSTAPPVVTGTTAPEVTTAPSAVPTVAGNPAKYALTSQEFPSKISLLLKENGKFVEKTSSFSGAQYNDNCGVVFLAEQIVNSPTLLTPEQQQAQSIAMITGYEKRAGKASKIAPGMLNTNEQIAGTSDNYGIETEAATFSNKQYAGILHTRVFANGTGIAFTFLCRAGTQVPNVDDNMVLNIG